MWYQRGASQTQSKNNFGEALAVLESKSELVERRPTKRIIWEPLREGDNLYVGEAVRTGSSASGKISFIKSGITFGLEPDSLVIIEEQAGALQLNLVNGGVFVRNDAETRKTSNQFRQPVIKAGDKKIELSDSKSSALNLSVAANGAANISVTKGDVKLADTSGKSIQISEGATKSLSTNNQTEIIEITDPKPGSTIPVISQNDQFRVSWLQAPANSKIHLEIGNTRDSLRRSGVIATSDIRQLTAPLPLGYFFWQLVAERDGKIVGRGPIIFNQSLALDPPKLISNANGEIVEIIKNQENTPVLLSWSRPSGAESVTIVIAKDERLLSPITKETLTSETELKVNLKDPGTYHWAATASWSGIKNQLTSKVGTFNLGSTEKLSSKSPPVPAQVTKLGLADPKLAASPIELIPGRKSYSFEISGAPENTDKLRYKIAVTDQLIDAPWTESKSKKSLEISILRPGKVYLKFEALDSTNKTVGVSDDIALQFYVKELLPPPTVILDGKSIKASDDGGISLKWSPVKGASKYLIQISGPKTKYRKEITGVSLKLTGLMPGNHQLVVTAIDDLGKLGKPGSPILLEVPEFSAIKAPTVKGLKVR